ncbi:uncharacterized protein [Euwallacea fornicatus]|uniref:uncharacterized protein n=1 Tax=Euwallacea fornicatus TaxID=995702 RepID=UPI00338FA211
MERVIKIKMRSEPDVSNQYPSERRYSASIVLGLCTMVLMFSLFSLLLGSLVVHKITITEALESNSENNSTNEELLEKLERDLQYSHNHKYLHYHINIPVAIAGACFLMSLGNFLGFLAGLLAWKRWYIDQNITVFFITCCISSFTSAIAFVISVVTTSNITFTHIDQSTSSNLCPVSIGLAINIIILSLLSTIWSMIACKVAYNGMRSRYPEDIMDRAGRVQITTIRKGSTIGNIPVEVLQGFAMGRMVKYLPKGETHGLPHEESKAEYEQRVNSFLNGHHAEQGRADGRE